MTALMNAAQNGYDNIVNILMIVGGDLSKKSHDRNTALNYAAEVEADVNKKDDNGTTPLMFAAKSGYDKVANKLIDAAAKLDTEDSQGKTALMFAALKDQENVAKILIEKGAYVNRTDEFGQTVLYFAAKFGHIDIVHLLIKASDDIDAQDEWGDTSLMLAAKFGHLDVVNALLDAGASVNAQNQEGMTCLMNAAEKGYDNIVKVLTAAGSDVSKKSFVGNTALNYAAEAEKIDVVKVLTKVRSKTGDQNGSISLMAAIEKDHMAMVKAVIDGGIDLNKRFTSEDTVLHFAAGTGHPDAANMLINAGAALDALNEEKNTPLMMALKNRHFDTVNRLIDKGADVNNSNIKGETTLHCAAGTGHVDTVQILIEADVELDAQDREGLTPLMIALQNDCPNNAKTEDVRENNEHDEKKNYKEVANLLIEKGADINKKNMNGETALHFAAKTGHIDIMKKLVDALKKKQINKQIEAKAEMDAQNKTGWTPLMIAVKYGHNGIAEVLLNEGVDLNRKNKFGETALYHASDSGNLDATKKLLGADAKADTLNKDGWTPLMISLKNRHINIANILIRKLRQKSIKIKNKFGETALHFAVTIGDKDIVRTLIGAGAPLNTQTKNGWTPLMIALKYRHTNIMTVLIEKGVDLNQTTNKKETALHHATDVGDIVATRELIAARAEIYTQDENGNTPLMIAAEKGYANISETLISETRKRKLASVVEKQNKLGEKALHLAAKIGPINVIEKLTEVDVQLNAQTHDGRTPLIMAIANKQDDIANFLIEKRANINIKDKFGNTVWHFVSKTGSVSVLNKLKSPAKIDTPNEEGCTPLMIASRNGHKNIVEVLINKRTDANKVDKSGSTALHLAAEGGHIDIVERLTDATTNVAVKNNNGLTPLMIASKNGHDQIVQVLIQKKDGVNKDIGTDIDKGDKLDRTALHFAAAAGHTHIARSLIEAGAALNIPDNKGMTPLLTAANSSTSKAEEIVKALLKKAEAKNIAKELLNKTSKDETTVLMLAASNGQQKTVDILIKAGADINAQRESDGMTALMLAAYSDQEKIVADLIKAGARVNAQRKGDGMTALMFAASNGQQKIVDELINAGAEVNGQREKDGMTALMFAAYNGQQKVVDALLEAKTEVNTRRKIDGETALTLVREELILIQLAQSSIQKDAVKFLKENTVREKLRGEQKAAEPKARDLVEVIEKACQDGSLSEFEKDQIRNKFNEWIPVYKAIREKLLKAGGYDMTNIQNPERKYVLHITSYLFGTIRI